jgi:hypothetical protein
MDVATSPDAHLTDIPRHWLTQSIIDLTFLTHWLDFIDWLGQTRVNDNTARHRMYLPNVEAGGNTVTMDSMVPTAILGSELTNSQSFLQSYWRFIGDLSFRCVSL